MDTKFIHSADRSRLIIENTSDLIAVTTFSLNPVYTYVSPSHKRIMGYEPEDLIGKPSLELIHPDDKTNLLPLLKQYVEKKVHKLLTGKEPNLHETVQFRVRDKAGNWHYLESTANLLNGEILFISKDITERKQAENELRKREEQFRSLIETATDAILSIDTTGKIVFVNKETEKLYGYSDGELIGKNITVLLPERFREYDKQAMNNALQCNAPGIAKKTIEGVGVKKDGTEFSVELSSKIWTTGAETFATAIIRDITERKRSDDELKENARFLSNILSSIQDGISILDRDMRIMMVNNTMKKWYAHAMPLIGKKCYEAYHGSSARCEFCPTYKTITTGEPAFDVVPLHGANGEAIGWLDLFSYPLKDLSTGEFIGVIEYVRDITAHKKTQESLRESEERFSTLLENANDAIFIADSNGTVKFWNHKAAELYGYLSEEIIGKPYTTIVPKRFRSTHQQWMEKFLSADEAAISGKLVEGMGERKDGSEFFVETSTAILRRGDERLLIAIIRDVTERKRIEQSMQKVEKLESLGILAGGIAHDFNNIITAILGNVSLTKMFLKPEEKIFKNLSEAEKACGRARDLTQQLLTFAKGGAPVKKTTSIFEIISETSQFVLRGSKVRCEFHMPDDLWAVEVDEGQMSQVIHNIILNADQAMPQGGIITIGAENVTCGEGHAVPVAAGRYVKVSIHDQGVGIPKDYLVKVFDPFFTTKHKGSGLGLATAYSIIKNHGGYIEVDSDAGTGTTFTFYLPASDQALEKAITPDERCTKGEGNILVMDDEEMIRDVASAVLAELGYKVYLAQDGTEAVNIYQQSRNLERPFAAVILDLTVPGGMGGEEALKRLRAIDPGVKAIVSSGYSNDPIMADYKQYGFNAVIAKPYKIADMSAALHKVINNSSV
jgi:PAS domain S-box-containing protein